jgi:N-acetylglucosaminyl-diphospho-decaprenol L-rhamnosyltransferase
VGVVTVVVTHRNRPERLARSIEAYADQTVPVRLVLVDSGSTPEHAAAASALLREGDHFIGLPVNSGFGPSANAGWRWWLEHGEGDWVGLAPDDALPAPDAVERILAAVAVTHHAGLACGDFGDGCSPRIDPYLGSILGPAGATEGWDDVDHPHGTLLFAHRRLLTEVGLFDERYFAYCEEADLALRARRNGWRSGLVRGAMVENPHLGTRLGAVDYLQQRNTLLLIGDHFGPYKAFFRYCTAVVQVVLGLVKPSARNPYWVTRARFLALRDGLLRRWGAPPASLYR